MADDNGDFAAAYKGVVLIVLFGNENDDDGRLRPIALERCAKAAQLAQECPETLILPTGAFGKHFNSSPWPHGELLRNHLLTLGISPDRILPFTNSSGTLEDVLFARKVAVDLQATRVVFVTSSFHMSRVQYICGRIFSDFEREFVPSDDPSDHSEKAPSERNKLATLKAERIDVPLYSAPPRGTRFPLPVYANASREHKHYDFLSYLFISAIFLTFAFPFSVDPVKAQFCTHRLFLLSAFAILLLYAAYYRAAHTARTARRVMRFIEAQYGQPGFSFNHPRQAFPVLLTSFFAAILAVLAGAMVAIQIYVALTK